MRRRRLGHIYLDMVRAIEAGNGDHVSVKEIANRACIAQSTAITYVSQIRSAFGYTAIEGTPMCGYRIGEWPGREVPRPYRKNIPIAERRRIARMAFDSSEGVVVTAAGRALGL